MDLAGALAYLDEHLNLETATEAPAAARRLESVRRLVELMGDPQRAYPVLHLTGTNGKGSTAAMLTSLLVARGLSVGTYTSPHLERLNERMAWNGDAISNDALVEVIEAVALTEVLLDERPTVFDILTAGAFRWFADIAVDAAVVEVGLGGRWDATNVADGEVALVTNVSLDHAEVIGPTLADIASEKAGIVKPGSTLVLGETGDALAPIFRDAGAAAVWERGRDFDCDANVMAVGGRVLELRTPGAHYDDVFVPLHGAHQGDNAALALAGAEAFFDAPLDHDVVTEAFAAVSSPGRMEVAGRELAEEFGTDMGRVLVVGFLRGRDPVEMLSALDASLARLVVACTPPSPRALPAADVAGAARSMGLDAFTAGSVAEGLARALDAVEPAEMMLVTGSLYVVGAARALLVPARHR